MRRGGFLASSLTLLATLGVFVVACLGGAGPGLILGPDATPAPLTNVDDASAQAADVDLGDPFAITGLDPSHGPFSGGTRTIITGRGFSTSIHVYFGATVLDPSAVTASDPQHIAVVTPPGPPGPVAVRVVDDASQQDRTLAGAFTYDALVVTPNTGATSGGTRIEVTGSGTSFQPGATVTVGGNTCTSPQVKDTTHIDCVTPASSGPGVQDVTVINADTSTIQARDAFTYSDAPDGDRGGLSGGILDGRITVVALDDDTGQPIPGAKVILGTNAPGAYSTSASGVVEIDDPSLTSPVTVTIAAKCHQPTTFVNVPVDSVTAYLDPTLDISCASGDPPSVGARGGHYGAEVNGELIFPGDIEFKRGPWEGVPLPSVPTERNAAYVFQSSSEPTEVFTLPPIDVAVTIDSAGNEGYEYSGIVYPGNVTLYALAGIEDRSFTPPRFTAYMMGVTRGIYAQNDEELTGVQIQMNTMIDHEVTLSATPPALAAPGPNQFASNIALTLGATGFAIMPNAQKILPLPLSGSITTVGLPSLDNSLTGESYVISAAAATGAELLNPSSVVQNIQSRNSDTPIFLGGFLDIPLIVEPAATTWSGTHVTFTEPSTFDLSVISIGGGLVSWTIVAPGNVTSFDLPDLTQAPGPDPLGLRSGAISTTVYTASINGFSYASVDYGQLGTASWNAYAINASAGAY